MGPLVAIFLLAIADAPGGVADWLDWQVPNSCPDAAKARLQRGDAVGALARLDEHAEEFPRGQLAEVRAATRVQALCRAGRTAEAEAAIAALHRDFPDSNVSRRLGDRCPAS